MALKIGDKAPEFLGLNQDGVEVTLSQYKGKKLAIYFYPKDSTPGCTAQACSYVMIGLINLTTYLLNKQIKSLEEAFLNEGGLRERMTKARIIRRSNNNKNNQ